MHPRPVLPILGAFVLLMAAGGCSQEHRAFGRGTFPARATAVGDPVGAGPCIDWRLVRVGHPIDPILGNPYPSREQAIGCSVDVNLQRELAFPADAQPAAGGRVLAPAPGPAAAGAVDRYYADKVKPLPERSTGAGASAN